MPSWTFNSINLLDFNHVQSSASFVPMWAIHLLQNAYFSIFFFMAVTGLIFARFPFTMLVLQKAVRMVWELPDVIRVAYAFVLVMLCWMTLWSFGVSGIVAFGIPNGGQWWLLLVSWQVFIIVLYLIQYFYPFRF